MMTDLRREYDRTMLRSAFQSLFWSVLLARKRQSNLTLKGLADKLGINKSYVSRSFSSPPNWQIDRVSDMSEALDVDLIVAARDRKTGLIFMPSGVLEASSGSTDTFFTEGRIRHQGPKTATDPVVSVSA
jgi:hypothetical protein